MAKRQTDTKPYDSTFKTLMYYCTDLLVALINYAFGEQFDLDAAVTFLQSEAYVTDKSGERRSRISDLVFRLMEHMLHHLYQEKLLYLNHTNDPVSQPDGHAFQKGLVADVFEIEAKRGLTQAETIAKHKGVRNVVEIIEKYRGREIDRGLGR